MNPEFQRNLWLEFTTRRVVFMVVSLGLVFLVGQSAGSDFLLRNSAEYLFYGIVVLWGTRNAAQAVVGEIRERTWDTQRLSSLTPFEMVWGKLFGATAYTWFGGLLCIAVLVLTASGAGGPAAALADLSYFLLIGLTAHAVALFASLVAVRRRQTHSRLDVFLYQLAGLIAACGVWWAWKVVTAGALVGGGLVLDEVRWWGLSIDVAFFYLVSLLIFLAWALVGCYRLMRLELSMRNTPIVWCGFLSFMVLYVAGQEGLEGIEIPGLEISDVVRPLGLALLTAAALTYAAAFAEPKDRVLYRWLGETAFTARHRAIWPRLQAWMVSYVATIVIGILLAFALAANPPDVFGYELFRSASVLSILGLVTRDIGIILMFSLMPNARRGEYPALVTIALLYFVAPALLNTFDIQVLFYPFAVEGVIGPIVAWAEAAFVLLLVYRSARRTVFGIEPAHRVEALQPEAR